TIGSTDLSYNYNQTTKLLSSITGGNKYSSFFYDIYGNITYNGDVGFTYNDASNLVSIGAKGLNYQYDGSNYRVSINDNGYLTYMQYNKSGSMVYEYDPQKQIGKSYIKVANMLVAREDNLETCDQIDTDGDGALDCQEYRLGTELNNPDTDEDGLNDGDEILSGLNPLLKDTDGDGMPDLYEINNSLNGLVNDADQDFDGDGITNFSEYSQGLSPSNPFVNKAYGTYKYESQQATGLSISRIVLDASNNVYFIRNNNEVVKLDANGLEVWSSTVIYNSVQLDISDELTINDDTIYLSAGSHIYRMPASTGVAEHIFDVATLSPGTKIKYKPSIRRDGLLFVIADDGITTGGSADTKHYLYVIDPITKSLVFDDDITNRKNPFMILQRPVFTENNTFILSDDTIYVHILPESLKSVGVVKLSKSTFGFNPVLMGNNKVLFQVHYPTVQVIIDVSGSRPVVSEGSDDITPLSEVIYGNNLHLVIGPDSGNTAYYRAKESVGSVTQFHLFTAPLVNDYGIHWLYGITKAYTYVNDYVNNYRLPIMPIVTRNNDLIISDGDKLISLNQELNPTYNYVMTRHVKWEKQLPDNIDQLALGHDGTIFVASKSGYIAAISDINSGLDASKMMMLGHDSQLSYTSGKGYTGAKLSITSPVTKTEVLPDTSINLLATATDVTGADISNQIVWVSSIDGVLGTGAIINATLSRGIHGISARLVDTNANPYIIDSIEVTVPTDSYPNIALFTPYQDAQYSSTASAMFNASASDIEDGDISTNIQWQSDVDGVLGVGSSLSVLLTPGSHTITISVTDSGYNTTQLTRPVTVLP
ncbi:MAG: DUF5011 domain-containing protein, partial [Gammaproteobacteria bacterium]|nr:DUF5011 domain-containing protein [Gammaproteobacteria bacterium]